VRRVLYVLAIAGLAVAGVLAFVSAGFVAVQLLDPRYPSDARIPSWINEGLGWVVGALLFVLAALRLRTRPADAWVAASLGAIVIAIASINANLVPDGVRVAVAIAGALAPWPAIVYPPSITRTAFVAANLAFVVVAPVVVAAIELPFWLRTFQPIDPLRLPEWLANRPIEWPWVLVVAPVAFGALEPPRGCCVGAPLHSSLLIVVPAALIGLVIWYYGRHRPQSQYAWHGPAGRATRRG
jgi:hypothetical protein